MKIVLLSEPGMPVRGLSLDLAALLAGQPSVEVEIVNTGAILARGIRGLHATFPLSASRRSVARRIRAAMGGRVSST